MPKWRENLRTDLHLRPARVPRSSQPVFVGGLESCIYRPLSTKKWPGMVEMRHRVYHRGEGLLELV